MTRTSRILAVVSAGLMFCLATRGDQNISLAWTASTDPTTAGYILHFGTATHAYTSKINVGMNIVVTLSGLKAGQTYYFAVGGYDKLGIEGMPSNEATFITPTNSVSTTPAGVVVTPGSGAAGARVYIYGGNLSGASSVRFNGVSASYTIVSNAVLAVTVPIGATTGPLNISTSTGVLTSQFVVVPANGPLNDNFTNAQVLTGATAFTWADTTYASKESSEPNHGSNTGGASVWYRWTAPASGTYLLDSEGTQFSPLLAVYTGGSVAHLTPIASESGSADGTLSFSATSGVTYQIAVDGYNGASGQMFLRLSPVSPSAATVYFDTFEPASGGYGLSSLAGQNGWLSTAYGVSGVVANYFTGYGQQGYIGCLSLGLLSNTAYLFRPLNYTVDINNRPVIQFSVLLQLYNPNNNFRSSFGWVFRNASGYELFGISFDDATDQVMYTLDDGAGARSTGVKFKPGTIYELGISADLNHNRWSAALNGIPIVAGQAVTTTHAAMTLGDVGAKAVYPASQFGADGMFFDNYTLTAAAQPSPYIVLGPQNRTVTAGSDVVLGVIAGGGSLSYQWYFNNVVIPGETSASLWLKDATPEQGGNYMVTIADAYGSVSANATVAVLSAQPRALLTSPVAMNNGGRMMNFNVENGKSYQLQASTNLASWSTLVSFYANNTNAVYVDSASTNYSQRFFRLVSP